MVKIFISKLVCKKKASYVFQELFRYIDIDFVFIEDKEEAHIVYDIGTGIDELKFSIPVNMNFWDNYKEVNSLPKRIYRKKNICFLYDLDIIVASFFLLTGYEEYIVKKRDHHNRFLYQHSNYSKDKIYSEPMIERYRDYIIFNLNKIGLICKRKNIFDKSDFGLFLSHDIDAVYKYRSTLKSIFKILLKPSKFNFLELIKSKSKICNDPYFKGFKYLIETSKRFNFKSTFFIISKIRNKLDDFYNISDENIKNSIK